ncbi:unnamed protein product [Orchesella dallaii]|uniref:RING-type E3 ubiquitin transferase n=1 Tax=Orchesella dallaii TaxID=48710 RepID=A0ABP1RR06_9HEXA
MSFNTIKSDEITTPPSSVEVRGDEGETNDTKTAATVLSAAKSYLECPVCYETLVSPIYQCQNGHIICNNCIERLAQCGECRVPLAGARIRNVALENICKSVDVKCPNRAEGCGVMTTVEKLKAHLEICGYHPINFCCKFLGWKECQVSVNDSSVLSHLEAIHPVKKLCNPIFRLWLNVWGFPLSEDEVHFDPLIIHSLDSPVLLRSMVSMDGHISFTCFMLKNSAADDLKNYRVTYRIESQTQDASLEWSGYVQSYRRFKKMNNINSFRISVETLKEYCEFFQANVFLQPRTKIGIKVAIWKTTGPAPSLQEDIYEEVDLFGQSCPHDPDLSSTVVFETVTCDGCRRKPIRNIRYKCLQCPDYDLCSRCMELRVHAHHVFARIQDLRQNEYFTQHFGMRLAIADMSPLRLS